jgi:hypothetical protein
MPYPRPNDEVLAMVSIQAMLVTEYIEDLRRSAAAERRAHPADVDVHLHPQGPTGSLDPRRALARVADRISRAAAATAERLDPALDEARLRRRTTVPGC